MSQNQHDLVNELPQYKDKITQLKNSNHHFRKLFDEYGNLSKEINKLEFTTEVYTDAQLEDLKKKRLALKDELMGIVEAA